MSIRSIDLQTLIPKTPEVQKIKSTEFEIPHNNINASIQSSQQQIQKDLKKVNQSPKGADVKINKERDKNSNNKKKKQEKKNNKEQAENDISIVRFDVKV